MTHLAILAASWPVTWVLFAITAWGGFALLLLTFGHRYHRWQAGKPVPYVPTEAAGDALGYRQVRSMLDACTWCKPQPRGLCSCERRCGHKRCVHVAGRGWMTSDRDILEGKKLP